MIILGAVIKTEEIIGIGQLLARYEGNTFWYEFKVITKASHTEFKSLMIKDVEYATKNEQEQLADFKSEYEHIRTEITYLLDECHEEFQYHAYKVQEAYDVITANVKTLEASIRATKAKGRDEWLKLINETVPQIIHLKFLAE